MNLIVNEETPSNRALFCIDPDAISIQISMFPLTFDNISVIKYVRPQARYFILLELTIV